MSRPVEQGKRSFGHSKDNRGDLPQVVIAMVTRDGVPVRCWTFPGNTADTSIIRTVKDDLAGWNLDRMVWVADRGFASQHGHNITYGGSELGPGHRQGGPSRPGVTVRAAVAIGATMVALCPNVVVGSNPMTAEKATSLRRGLDGLVALSGEEALANGGLGVVRLAELLGSDKSRVSRMLRILQEYELVERDPVTLAYRIGWRIYSLASVVGHARLLEEAPARLDRLMREFDEVTHLSVLSGMRVLQIASRSPDRGLNAGGVVTQAMPAHCTSSGRALLLDHDRRALQARFEGLKWEPARSNAPRDLDDLHARLEQARQFGYVVVIEEWEAGVVGVAAPVRDDRGFIVAAVSLAAPAFRFKRRLATAGRRVKSVAEELSHLIGWPAAALDCPEDPPNSRPRLAEPIAGAAPSSSAMPEGVANRATIAPRPT